MFDAKVDNLLILSTVSIKNKYNFNLVNICRFEKYN